MSTPATLRAGVADRAKSGAPVTLRDDPLAERIAMEHFGGRGASAAILFSPGTGVPAAACTIAPRAAGCAVTACPPLNPPQSPGRKPHD